MSLADTLIERIRTGAGFERANDVHEVDGDVIVAFLGDQGLSDKARRVLRIVKASRAQLVVHAGDLDYQDNYRAWDKMGSEDEILVYQ